jgi:hypothetical protein
MCFSSQKQPPVITRPDPNIKYVDGNIMNPKASPPEIDKTPVKKPEKKSSVSQSSDITTTQSSDLSIPTY